MSFTHTNSGSDSYTEARARYVMGKVYDQFHALILRQFDKISASELEGYRDDLLYLMHQKALISFELQFFGPNNAKWGLHYKLIESGLSIDDRSGGNDFWEIPQNAGFNLVLRYDHTNQKAKEYLDQHGWNDGASFIEGDPSNDGSYSKDGYGFNFGKKGDWS